MMTRDEFDERTRRLYQESDRSAPLIVMLLLAEIGAFVFLARAGGSWLRWLPIALVSLGGLILAIHEGRRFDRLLSELGLICPGCGARLAGDKGGSPRGLYLAVRRSGCCQWCKQRVIA